MIRARDEQLENVQQLIAQGRYKVDCQQVAAAMLERIVARVSDPSLLNSRDGGRVLLRALIDLRAVGGEPTRRSRSGRSP